jgi:hypothetical protein
MSQKAISVILQTRLNSWAAAQSPPVRVAWPNVPFTPTTGETYIRVSELPNDTDSKDLAGAHRLYQGVFQMTIVRPAGTGAGPAHDMVASLAAHFPVNGRYTSGSVTVHVTKPVSEGPPIQEGNTYEVPAWFSYRCDTI